MMSDKIYYRVQYPLKKGIQFLKKLDLDEKELEERVEELSEYEKSRVRNFLSAWEDDGRENLLKFIQDLRNRQNN